MMLNMLYGHKGVQRFKPFRKVKGSILDSDNPASKAWNKAQKKLPSSIEIRSKLKSLVSKGKK